MYDELHAGLTWVTSLPVYPVVEDDLAVGLALPWRGSYADSSVHGKIVHPGGEYFPALGCPSDGNARRTDGGISPSNYAGCNGDSLIGFWLQEQGRAMAARGVIKPAQQYNPITTNPDDGAYRTHSSGSQGETSLASIPDGTSNTMIVSEVVVGLAANAPDAAERDTRRGVAAAPADIFHFQAGPGSGIPANCAAVRASGNVIRENYAALTVPKAGQWLDARTIFSFYKATLPPNSPSCVQANDATTPDAALNYAPTHMGDNSALGGFNQISASSFHTGGVNVCMADGAVRFVSDSVDAGDPTVMNGGGPDSDNYSGYYDWHPGRPAPPTWGDKIEGHHWVGPSSYGVWGAIATPAGSESKSL